MSSCVFLSFQYTCKEECNKLAPYLSGVSEEACNEVYGGTFCPNPTNCTALETCVNEFIEEAETANPRRIAFLRYLKSSPNITESGPTDVFACGRAREYFGFAPNFPNDEAICSNVNELKTTNDFDLLEAFAAGSSGNNNPSPSPPPGVRPIMLEEPLRKLHQLMYNTISLVISVSNRQYAQFVAAGYSEDDALKWRTYNFGIGQAVATIKVLFDILLGIKCPCDPVPPACVAPINAICTVVTSGLASACLIGFLELNVVCRSTCYLTLPHYCIRSVVTLPLFLSCISLYSRLWR